MVANDTATQRGTTMAATGIDTNATGVPGSPLAAGDLMAAGEWLVTVMLPALGLAAFAVTLAAALARVPADPAMLGVVALEILAAVAVAWMLCSDRPSSRP